MFSYTKVFADIYLLNALINLVDIWIVVSYWSKVVISASPTYLSDLEIKVKVTVQVYLCSFKYVCLLNALIDVVNTQKFV